VHYAEKETYYCPHCQTKGKIYAARRMSRLLKLETTPGLGGVPKDRLMPELPEVEAAKRSLVRVLPGKVISSVDVRMPTAVRTHTLHAFAELLIGERIEGVSRRGKTLQVALTGGWTLLFHFKLWGLVRFVRSEATPDAQTAVALTFTDGSRLEFRELQLSELGLHQTTDLPRLPYLASLGVEPLSRAFTKARFKTLLAGRGTIRAFSRINRALLGLGTSGHTRSCMPPESVPTARSPL
jgi:formamidopyrimidine-DNA glycosylase